MKKPEKALPAQDAMTHLAHIDAACDHLIAALDEMFASIPPAITAAAKRAEQTAARIQANGKPLQ